MIFSNDKAIYVQIAERLSDEILAAKARKTTDQKMAMQREVPGLS